MVGNPAKSYDVVVVGAGHAGIEAAYAAWRAGMQTLLITLRLDKIAEMSCNPAVGGLAKGQIVCEIDALGGLMGQATDKTGIQFRLLNRSKGPAVWGPRAQVDKLEYARFMQAYLKGLDRLDIVEGEVVDIIEEKNKLCGVKLADGRTFRTEAAVITTGTFLNGLIHIGGKQFPAGRIGERPACGLSGALQRLGIRLGRLKTGTCPRLLKNTIDFDRCQIQLADPEPFAFSILTEKIEQEQLPCYITYTNPDTHKLILENLDKAPLFTGQIKSVGPRYCPSVELKVVRFPDKDRHQVYLEPESVHYDWIYCNGLSTSLPEDVQEKMVHSIVGLENAKIVQYGYAIEYDFVPPEQLHPSLESKKIRGLFFAGQINGTSGYEEAAGQGIIAGINAALYVKGKDPLILRRDQSYIAVMIDDLVTKGVDEPYRMFTSRAEFRLLLRADTAERRLSPIARQLGILDDERWRLHLKWERQRSEFQRRLKGLRIDGISAYEWLKRPENDLDRLRERADPLLFYDIEPRIQRQVVIDIKYEGYIRREVQLAKKLQQLESIRLPADIDYFKIDSLRFEAKEKLNAVRPETLAQASRISGISPADIMTLMISLGKRPLL